jgi:hypothetical protein
MKLSRKTSEELNHGYQPSWNQAIEPQMTQIAQMGFQQDWPGGKSMERAHRKVRLAR